MFDDLKFPGEEGYNQNKQHNQEMVLKEDNMKIVVESIFRKA